MAAAPMREGFVEDDDARKKVTPIKSEAPQIEHSGGGGDDPPQGPAQEEVDLFTIKWPMRIKLLYRPIRNNKNEEINEIVFREPTGGDINRYGSPVRMASDGMFDIEDRKMAMMMAGLSGINLPFLERMDPRDWQSCAYRLKIYFQPDTTGWL
jgi:tail assembly chaperone E/41/14-like protein